MPSEARAQAAASYEVWPEHWEAVKVFESMQSQWNWISGMGGAARTGLKYEALATVPRWRRVQQGTPEDEEEIFAQLQVLEDEALAIFAERRD